MSLYPYPPLFGGVFDALALAGRQLESAMDVAEKRRKDEEALRRQELERQLRAAEVAFRLNPNPHTAAAYERTLQQLMATDRPFFPRRKVQVQVGERPVERPGAEAEAPKTEPIYEEREEIVIPGVEKPVTFREFARSVGLTLTPDQERIYGDRPWQDVVEMNKVAAQAGRPIFPALTPQATAALDDVRKTVDHYVTQISRAAPGTARAAWVEQARAWTAQVLAQFPQLKVLIPDWAALGQSLDQEAEQAARISAESKSKQEWARALQNARARLEQAKRGKSTQTVADAVREYNQYIAEGKRRGWISSGALDVRREVQAWMEGLSPMEKYRRGLPLNAREFREVQNAITQSQLDIEAKKAFIARAYQLLREGEGGEPRTEEKRIGRYRIITGRNRAGHITSQRVVDERGVLVGPEILRHRAAQGDQDAQAILGVQPPSTPQSLSDEDLQAEIRALEEDLRQAQENPLVSPATKQDLRKALRELKAEQARRSGKGGKGGKTLTRAQAEALARQKGLTAPAEISAFIEELRRLGYEVK